MKDSYHHGNLRQALIDAGIKIVNERGEDALSLRKVAAACGVSHAAPYAHFPDKESLLDEIKKTVSSSFAKELEQASKAPGITNAEEAILAMGQSFILFFRKNPDYYNFLFHKQNIQIHTDMTRDYEGDYEPFLLLKNLFRKYLSENNIQMSLKQQELELIKTWALVQGLSSIAVMKNVHMNIDWNELSVRGLTH